MSVLITGVAGFIGSHVAQRFVSEGYSVIGIDDLSTGKKSNVNKNIEFIEGDLADDATTRYLPTDVSTILHLAGQSSGEISFDNPVSDLHKNTISTLNLINYAMKNNVSRFIYASSMSVYGSTPEGPVGENFNCNPLSCYGASKLASENYLSVYKKYLPSTVLRMFNVYGPGQDLANMRQGMVSIFVSQALKTGNIQVKGSLDRYRDFVYIDDVVEAWFRSAMQKTSASYTINVGTGVKTTLSSLLNLICKLIPETSFFSEGSTPGDQPGIYANVASLKNILMIDEAISLETGLQKFINSIDGGSS